MEAVLKQNDINESLRVTQITCVSDPWKSHKSKRDKICKETIKEEDNFDKEPWNAINIDEIDELD